MVHGPLAETLKRGRELKERERQQSIPTDPTKVPPNNTRQNAVHATRFLKNIAENFSTLIDDFSVLESCMMHETDFEKT